jgi:hypothetical protein
MRGEDIRRLLPDLVELGRSCFPPLAEAFVGRKLQVPRNQGRAIRIQIFDDPSHRLPWHYDVSRVDCLLTLRNDNGSQTQVVSPKLSRTIRPLFRALVGGAALFSVLPRTSITAGAGDLLLLAGSGVLHRGVPTRGDGERILVVFAYEDENQPANPIRDRLIKYLYTRRVKPPTFSDIRR